MQLNSFCPWKIAVVDLHHQSDQNSHGILQDADDIIQNYEGIHDFYIKGSIEKGTTSTANNINWPPKAEKNDGGFEASFSMGSLNWCEGSVTLRK